eukprot:6188653-Pleurochrysis_carterae.AAC.3
MSAPAAAGQPTYGAAGGTTNPPAEPHYRHKQYRNNYAITRTYRSFIVATSSRLSANATSDPGGAQS